MTPMDDVTFNRMVAATVIAILGFWLHDWMKKRGII